eukprot:63035-Chlamydomonas_euryale.AAC.5
MCLSQHKLHGACEDSYACSALPWATGVWTQMRRTWKLSSCPDTLCNQPRRRGAFQRGVD